MRFALFLSLSSSFLLACARAGAEGAAAAPTPVRPILVELFTSQGCSSCPPADRLLARLAAVAPGERAIVPLAFHVDYWNHLGWQDPFSSADWSERQRRYGVGFGGGRIYTPELVVAGSADCVGTDEAGLQRLVARAAAEPVRASVQLTPAGTGEGKLTVEVAAQRVTEAGAAPTEVLVALFENGLETPVGRGENAHRRLHNDRVVRRLVRALALPAGGGDGKTRLELPLDPAWGRSHLGLVAFVQEPSTLRVLAATEAAVR
ncbi:MAG TPA: DUF1223 domain-containing protein [Thermoanaerobaculia bacterium]|jgi:hypothetical protein|nr:DUF1223 domain-containing protein [Thermoanaerobaculia bacterium]